MKAAVLSLLYAGVVTATGLDESCADAQESCLSALRCAEDLTEFSEPSNKQTLCIPADACGVDG